MISICMPYRSRPAQLQAAIDAYAGLYSGIEISIVDDGSPDGLAIMVPDGISVVVDSFPVRSYALNPCAPINRAVANSSGDIILLTNPETIHIEPIIEQMFESIDDWRDYVQAAVREGDKWLARSDYRDPVWAPFPNGFGPHFCAMFDRRLWNEAGGFDEDYRLGRACDDNDWAWRVWLAGGRPKWRDDLVVSQQRHGRTQWPEISNRALLAKKWSHEW